jgi:hypothetical protein
VDAVAARLERGGELDARARPATITAGAASCIMEVSRARGARGSRTA